MASDKVYQQLEAVRRSGKTNMMDVNKVQVIAYKSDYYELTCFIEDSKPGEVIRALQQGVELGYREMDELPVDPVPERMTVEVDL